MKLLYVSLKYYLGVNGMLNKLFSFLGFNSGENLVGLSHLTEEAVKSEAKLSPAKSQKDVKLSDLLRGA